MKWVDCCGSLLTWELIMMVDHQPFYSNFMYYPWNLCWIRVLFLGRFCCWCPWRSSERRLRVSRPVSGDHGLPQKRKLMQVDGLSQWCFFLLHASTSFMSCTATSTVDAWRVFQLRCFLTTGSDVLPAGTSETMEGVTWKNRRVGWRVNMYEMSVMTDKHN